MTPEHLRQIAAQREAESNELVRDALQLRSHASVLTGVFDPLIPGSKRVWTGPAAADFELRVKAQAGRLDQGARALACVASEFDRLAARKRSQAEQLRAAAAAAEPSLAGGV